MDNNQKFIQLKRSLIYFMTKEDNGLSFDDYEELDAFLSDLYEFYVRGEIC